DVVLDRAVLVLAVRRLLRRVGIRIGEPRIELRQRLEHRLRAIDDPHDLAAPLDVDLLSGLELGDVDVDGRAGGLRALAGEERHHERCGRAHDADSTDVTRRAHQKTPLPAVYRAFSAIRHDNLSPDPRPPSRMRSAPARSRVP